MLPAVFVVSIGFVTGIPEVTAHEGADGIIKLRMESMKSMGEYSKAVADMLKGKSDFDSKVFQDASDAFIRHGQDIPTQFPDTPESREDQISEASPDIWNDWQKFASFAEQFSEDSRRLESLVARLEPTDTLDSATTREVRAAFFKTVKSCSGCHKRFRVERH